MAATVLPLPLVPATWKHGTRRCGFPNASRRARVRSRPSRTPPVVLANRNSSARSYGLELIAAGVSGGLFEGRVAGHVSQQLADGSLQGAAMHHGIDHSVIEKELGGL